MSRELNVNESHVNGVINGDNNKQVKSNNRVDKSKQVTKVVKKTSKKKKKSKNDKYVLMAHEGMDMLALSETTPQTPRESLKHLYNMGIREIENVTFFVKGYLPSSENTKVTVENVCSTKLLTYHCQIVVEDNPIIVDYIGETVTFDIEIYPYPDNEDKFSFNLIGEPIDVGAADADYSINIKHHDICDIDAFIKSMLEISKESKTKIMNSMIADLNYVSNLIYGNEHLISNLILNTLMMSLDIDDRVIYENDAFINKHMYDIMLIYIKIYTDIYEEHIRDYKDLKEHVLKIVGIYTDSPYINQGKKSEEFLRSCMYFDISMKQAKFYYSLFDNLKDKPICTQEERRKIIDEMKSLAIDYRLTTI